MLDAAGAFKNFFLFKKYAHLVCDCGTWLFNGKYLEKSPIKKSSQTSQTLFIAPTVAHSMKLHLSLEKGDKTKLAGD